MPLLRDGDFAQEDSGTTIMAFSVVMPALEMAQETGKLVAWRKAEGEPVTKGEPLLEIETDKAVLEVESPADGVLAGVKAQAGDIVPVGNVIAWIVALGEAIPSEVLLPAVAGGHGAGRGTIICGDEHPNCFCEPRRRHIRGRSVCKRLILE